MAAVGVCACGVSASGKAGHKLAMVGSHIGSSRVVPAPAPAIAGPCAVPAATSARAAADVAERVYRQELTGEGVWADRRQVESYEPLLQALASENRGAVREAVTQLVFSHTHIVRLRVISKHGLTVDVGGPYIIAPVEGTLRLHGRAIGRYVLSVQDDLGYVKLETRFVGVPLALFADGRELPIEGTARMANVTLSQFAPFNYRGGQFNAYSFTARSFPSGRLRVTLLVPPLYRASGLPCEALRAKELGMIGRRIWSRFALASAPPAAIVRALARLTGALAYVRAGSARLAGSTTHWPSPLPPAGAVRYRGRTHYVVSFAANDGPRRVRVYMLF